MTTMKQARKQFANRSHVVRTVHDKNGAAVDIKVRKRNPKGDSFRAWARSAGLPDPQGKLKEIVAG